jgi:thiamine biosynthesis protein ThiI
MSSDVILIKYGEIALRVGNRRLYEDKLIRQIKSRLIKHNADVYIRKEQGRFIAETQGEFSDTAVEELRLMFGLVSVCHAVKTNDNNIENIRQIALGLMADKSGTFKVESRRADKTYPLTSYEISADVGGYILENIDSLTVDVKKPSIILYVEIRNSTYIYIDHKGASGGLPSGTAGRGMLLLSGGIDSPVAGYYTAKRGVELHAVYFHSPPYTSDRAKQKVLDLAERLSKFTGYIKLYVINFTDTQLYLKAKVPPEKLTIMLKRVMLRIAEKIALNDNCLCLITGDSIGQVASQTLHSLVATGAVCSLPIIRPLAGFDKQEIVDVARKIGTFDISKLPYQDCCTVFVADHPETKPKASIIESIERKLSELENHIEKNINEMEEITWT